MTTPPNPPPLPDPRRILAKMNADVRAFEARARRTNDALAASAVEAVGDACTVRMLGAHLVGIAFHDQALALSPAQLAEEVRRTVAEATVRANRSSADVVRHAFGDEAAAAGVEAALPDDLAEERDRLARDTTDATDGDPSPLRPMTLEEQEDLLDDLLNRMDADDESVDIRDIARELDYARNRSVGAPEDQQALFLAEMDRLKANAAALPRLVQSVEGTAGSEAVEITVNAAGALLSTRFRAAFTRLEAEALAADFLETYAAARTEAGRRLTEELGDSGLDVPDDVRRGLGL
ncbi:hypothetical protein [Mariniluteicoccus flavus]